MEYPPLSPQIPVADLLAVSPLAAGALIELRVDCVGCSMTKFCTLEEMCRQYELEVEPVVRQITQRLAAI